MIEAPGETAGILVANPFEHAVALFLDAALEPVRSQDRNEGESEYEGAEKGEAHGVGHGMEELSGGAAEGVDGKITGDDDGDGVEDGAIDISRGGENDFVEAVGLSFAQAELAVNVLDHDDSAVNDDAEVDGADGEEVGGFAGLVQEDESEKKSEGNGERGDDGGANADEEKDENEKDENHAAEEIAFYGVSGNADEVAAVVEGTDFDVGRKNGFIELLGFALDAGEDVLGLFAFAHKDDAFDGVVVVFGFVLEAEDAEAGSVADDHAANVFHANGSAVGGADDDFADVVGGFEEAEAAHVVKLAALGEESAAGVGIIGGESVEDLDDGQVIAVEAGGIEQDVVLHGRPAETGVVGDAGNAAVGAGDDPIVVSVELGGSAIGAFENVAIDEAAGTEERGHAGRDALGKGGVADAFENELAGEVGIDAFVEGKADIGEAVERNRTHHLEVRGAVHGQLDGESGKALDFFSGVAGPLGDEFDHGRGEIGVGVDGHLAEGPGTGKDDEQSRHEDEKTLMESELDDAVDHGRGGACIRPRETLGIEERFFTALGPPAAGTLRSK